MSANEAVLEIERLEKVIADAQLEQSKWRTILGLKQQLGEPSTVLVNQNGESKPTLRQAITLVLENKGPGSAMRLRDIGDELVRRGWLGQSERDNHRLQMMASDMKKKDQLERPGYGLYRLPLKVATEAEETEGNGNSEEISGQGDRSGRLDLGS